MQALVTQPGVAGSTHVAAVPEANGDGVLLRVLEVGVCGTDREISHGLFGIAPADGAELVLGHELLGLVERDGHGFTRGDLVTATVRRSCRHCLACAEGFPDSCLTGDYVERGITRLNGFASELVVEDPGQLVPIPRSLGRLGVLAEPASICERALRHARAIGNRQPWELQRALVLGAGAVGTLATYLLRLSGVEVWTASLEPTHDLVSASGAQYVPLPATQLQDLGGFDLVVEAAGDAQLMADALGLLRRSGVACLLGIDPRVQRSRSKAAPWRSTRSSRTASSSAASTRPARTGSGPSPISTAPASAGRTSSSSSSACASRSTGSRTPSPIEAARQRSSSPTETRGPGSIRISD